MATMVPGVAPGDMAREAGVRGVLRAAGRLGLADVFADMSAFLVRVDDVDRHMAELHVAGGRARAKMISDLVAGNAPSQADLVLAGLAVKPNVGPSQRVHPLLTHVKVQARAVLHAQAHAAGAAAMGELYRRGRVLVDEAVATVGAARLPARAVTDADLLADSATATAYVQVRDACDRFEAVHALMAGCRRVGWLGMLPDEMSRAWTAFKDPSKRLLRWRYQPGGGLELLSAADLENVMSTGREHLAHLGGQTPLVGPLVLWHAVRAGAGPGLYDDADAVKRWTAYVNKQRAANALRPMPPRRQDDEEPVWKRAGKAES